MSDRRKEARPDPSDRRTFPRPPLWLNLLLLVLGAAVILYGQHHREQVSARYAHVLTQEQRTPKDVKQMKDELAEMDLTRQELEKELEGRMKYLQSLKSENFYLSIDTQAKKFRFSYGDSVLREGDLTVGESRTIKAPDGKSWTFIPVKGAFPVEGKAVEYSWRVPDWVYLMNNEPVPASPRIIEGALGKYVLFLPNGYVIHTQPSESSPLKGAKPGSFLVSEADLAAIWPRIEKGRTQVYIF